MAACSSSWMHEAVFENVLMILRSIWFAMGSSAHPYLVRQLSTEDARQSTEGYHTMVDLSVGVRIIRNRMVTQGAETAI